jgi:hypothetical protein
MSLDWPLFSLLVLILIDWLPQETRGRNGDVKKKGEEKQAVRQWPRVGGGRGRA